ncbi:MAG: hypothetical protein AAGC45_04260 [Bacteroidota bacterium]
MVSSFFDKTKPINFLVLLGAALVLFWGVTLRVYGFQLGYPIFFSKALATACLLLSVFFLGTMVKTKKLTLDNSFAMLFFLSLLLFFPDTLRNNTVVFSGFFLLLSMNRAIALRDEKNHKEKIFESALWIYVASFFSEWSLLFIIALYMAINLFGGKQLRLWLMPIAALICTLILAFTATLFFNNTGYFLEHYRFPIVLDFFLKPNYGMLFYILLMVAAAILVFGKLGYRRLGRTLSLRLIFAYLVISILIIVATGNSESGLELFSFFPAAIFCGNYLETVKKQKFKEITLLASIILPIMVFAIWLLQ